MRRARRLRSRTTALRGCIMVSAAMAMLLAGTACAVDPPDRNAAAPGGNGGGTVPPRSGSRPVIDVAKELRALERSKRTRIGAYALDTATGRTVSHRATERFPAMSTFKAIVGGAILRKSRTADPDLMRRVIRWTKKDLVTYSPVTGREENIADGLSVSELCEAAIVESDNTAANLLLRQIGGPAGMTRYYRSLGDPASRLDHWESDLNQDPRDVRDTTTPEAMSRNLRMLALGDHLVPEDRQTLIGWLRAARTGDERIRAGLPKGWAAGDKTGTSGEYAVANDIAIAWPHSGAPVIIGIFTNRETADAEVNDRVIATAASILMRGLGKGA